MTGVATRALLAAGAALLLGSAGTRAAGSLVLVGGALSEDNDAVYRAVLDRRAGDGPVCVLPTASGTPRRSMRSYVRDFERVGGRGAAVGVPLFAGDVPRAASPALARRLLTCAGFFFTGGDQSRIVDTFRPDGRRTLGDRVLHERFGQGAVVAGSSAGAAMASDPMIGDGDSADALSYGATRDPDGRGVWIRDGMGFARDALADQHHLRRGRFGRLLAALDDASTPREGWGIDEDTALVLDPDGALSVVGRSAVLVVRLDERDAASRTRTGVVYLLVDGDRLGAGGRLTHAGSDAPAPGEPPAAPDDPWKGPAFHDWLAALCRAGAPGESLDVAGGDLGFSAGDGFAVWASAGPDGVTGCGPLRLRWERKAPRP